jgi:hypothetical protein
MRAVKKSEQRWANRLLNNTQSLGNTGESILDKCSDLLNDYCKTEGLINDVAERAGLSPNTIRRIMERKPTEEGREPDAFGDTQSRILLTFGATITWGQTSIRAKFLPQPKVKHDE